MNTSNPHLAAGLAPRGRRHPTHGPTPAAQSRSRAHKAIAFTLIELLVVVSIIALLIAILLPAMRKARESAQIVACASNLRQLTAATLSYAGDSYGNIPQAGASRRIDMWHADFADTLRNHYLGGNREIMRCPTMPALTEQQFLTIADPGFRLAYYIATMNPCLDPGRSPYCATADLDGDGSFDNFSVSRMTGRGDRVLFADDVWVNNYGQWQVNTGSLRPGIPHAGIDTDSRGTRPLGSNHARLDGSVQWYNFAQMQPIYSYWGTINDDNRDVWW